MNIDEQDHQTYAQLFSNIMRMNFTRKLSKSKGNFINYSNKLSSNLMEWIAPTLWNTASIVSPYWFFTKLYYGAHMCILIKNIFAVVIKATEPNQQLSICTTIIQIFRKKHKKYMNIR